jgi:hypothetical protein
MTTRICLSGLLILVCLGTFGIIAQHRQLAGLKDQRGQILAQLSGPLDAQPALASTSQESGKSEAAESGAAGVSSELLQLRNQVGQLTERKRELTGVRVENERLQAQLAGRRTNSTGEKPFPPDYIRKSTAQWVGLNTPENTLQSFLWALENRDATNLLRVLTPEAGAQLLRQFNNSPETLSEQSSGIPGMLIVGKKALPDGSFELKVEMMPGTPFSGGPIHVRLIDNEWRLDPVH